MQNKTRVRVELGRMVDLINAMVLKGANKEELMSALKHSQVILDSEKLGLNIEASATENNIQQLRNMYLSIEERTREKSIERAKARKSDFLARQILADLAGMTVNDTTNTLTTRIIFGR